MNKKFNIIKLSGFKGVLLILFIAGCLLTGFLVFPGWLCMHVWNFLGGFFDSVPLMNIYHGVLLWCIFALSFYALNKNSLGISYKTVSPAHTSLRSIIKEEPQKAVLENNDENNKIIK